VKVTSGKFYYQPGMLNSSNADNQIGSIVAKDTHGDWYLAAIEGDAGSSEEECRNNAILFVTAVNACKQINPDNPIAAAEAINDLYQIIRELYFKLPLEKVSIVMKRRIAKVLTKALRERQDEADG
jgi:hypothetical protein